MNKSEAIKQIRAARDAAVANLEALQTLRSALCVPADYSMGEEAVRAQIDSLNKTLEFLGADGDA